MIKIITDSTSYIPKDFAEKNNITIIPLSYIIGEKDYVEGYADTFEAAFERIFSSKEHTTTSQPALSLFLDEYQKVIAGGDEAIVLTISSQLSGTHSAATLAKESCSDPSRITIIDSGSCGQVVWGYAMEILEYNKQNLTSAQIVERIEHLKIASEIQFCPDSLEYLKKGGRIGTVDATIGSLLQIKPILSFNRGKLRSTKKTIGMSRAITEMVNAVPANAKHIFVIRISNSKYYERMKEGIYKKFKNSQIFESELGPVVGAHIGPAIGAAWVVE